MLGEVKKAGNFVYMYQEDETVLVAYRAGPFNVETQKLISKRMSGFAEKIEENMELVCNGDEYIGILYKAIPECVLYCALTR